MGIFTRNRQPEPSRYPVIRNTMELAERYDLIEVTDGAIIVKDPVVGSKLKAPPPYLDNMPSKPNMRELGGTGQTNYTNTAREDYNPELRGWYGLQVYERMRKSDGQVRGVLRLVKTPVLAARWYVDTEDETFRGQKIAEHIHRCLFNWMSTSFPQFLTEALLMLDFGFYTFEKVYAMKEGKVIWQKFAPRHPFDVTEWVFDQHGGPTAMKMRLPNRPDQGEITIPMDKLAVFTFDKEGGDMQGVSVLRSAYKHWFYKENLYKIDAIQKERHGIGIPIIKLPPSFDETDKSFANEIGRNLRSNEKAHVVLPPLWEIMMLKMEGQPVDALESAMHHDLMIARNVLGQFLNSAQGSSQEEQQELFLKATRYIAETIRDVINKYCIPQLVIWNYGERDIYPELRVRRIGDTVDWRTVSFAIRNFIGAGVIVPDDKLEAWVRSEMDLPKADPESARIIVPPQEEGTIPDGDPDSKPGAGGPKTDETRQNQGAGNLTPNKADVPKQSNKQQGPGNNGRVGLDKSGG